MGLIESLRKALLEFNITDEAKEVEEIFYKIGHKIVPIEKYISSGYWGDVFKVKGTNKVVKITKDTDEFRVVEDLIGKEFDYVINYFFATEYKRDHYLIVAEYLEPLNVSYDPDDLYLKGFFRSLSSGFYQATGNEEKIQDAYDTLLFSMSRRLNDKELAEKYMLWIKDMRSSLSDKMYETLLIELFMNFIDFIGDRHRERFEFIANHEKLLHDIDQGLQELKSEGVVFEDVHLDNILLDPKTNNYKLIDIRYTY